eukprot:15080297-Alexandrium_andersonii.AAC.1
MQGDLRALRRVDRTAPRASGRRGPGHDAREEHRRGPRGARGLRALRLPARQARRLLSRRAL